MQIKNNIKILLILFFSLFVLNFNLYAEVFNITAKEIVNTNLSFLVILFSSLIIYALFYCLVLRFFFF